MVRQDILWKKFFFESTRTLKLGKSAVQVRLGEAVVIQENVVPHDR